MAKKPSAGACRGRRFESATTGSAVTDVNKTNCLLIY